MYRPRIIPVLLLKDQGLVKSIKFKKYRYIGDPINAVKIFNDLCADELVLLDIDATKRGKPIDLDFVSKVGEEANMPFSVGGGITNLEHIRQVLEAGAEKVILNSVALVQPDFVKQASTQFGSSTISVCMDYRKGVFSKNRVVNPHTGKKHKLSVMDYALEMEALGAGEIIVQSMDRDGTMEGYDIEMIRDLSNKLTIPITALGGAGKLQDLQELNKGTIVNGLGAGSIFVYHGPRNAVLVNYPKPEEIASTLNYEQSL